MMGGCINAGFIHFLSYLSKTYKNLSSKRMLHLQYFAKDKDVRAGMLLMRIQRKMMMGIEGWLLWWEGKSAEMKR